MAGRVLNEREVPLEDKAIYLRGYVVREKKPVHGAFDHEAEEVDALPPSDWSLTFDCETTTDEAQALRFGAYQLRKNGELAKHGLGLFHAEDLNDHDLAVLRRVAEERGARLLTVGQFAEWVLFEKIYERGGTVIGFNLPFDLSRIAVKHGKAKTTMRGGFSFQVTNNTFRPRIRVKHVSSKIAFIRYGARSGKTTPDSMAKRGLNVPHRRGSFVDVKTLASGILAGSYSLLTLSRDALKVANPKLDIDEHGGPLTEEYVRYGMRDVQATWECYVALNERLKSYRLTTIRPSTLYSPASLGKAYLKQMGIKPWRDVQSGFAPERIGEIMSTYYGGRAEVNIRREKRQVLYCDFLSMYPTVCTLMGLWRFVISNGLKPEEGPEVTAEIQALLDRITVADMMSKPAWRELTTLVQLRPDDEILAVRARYGGETSTNIGVNRLTSDEPLWYTLADVIAAKVLSDSGKTPIIERAVRYRPGGVQPDLQPINISGNAEYRVDPVDGDFYRRVIDLRQEVRAKARGEPKSVQAVRNQEQLALKILANATSYGIFIEMVVQDLEKAEVLKAYGVEGREFPVTTNKYEEPGFYFHPLLATLITGAARLMLALAEHQTKAAGLDWVFCDTDSITIAKPTEMDPAEFIETARKVCTAFKRLNPYEVASGSILKIEDQNYALDDHDKSDLENAPPLYCYAVSAKRYALFNDGPSGEPIIRKASAHGLGHLLPPYEDLDKKRRGERIGKLGVDLWQEELWMRIIKAAAAPEKTQGGAVVGFDKEPRLAERPVASRYGATTPALLKWFTTYNKTRPYERKVRPFGFLLSLQCEKMEQIAYRDPAAQRWRQKYKSDPAPVAPFDRDPSRAADHAFDRRRPKEYIPRDWLISYADALSDYHLQPETKFSGGEVRRGSGKLSRRHIRATVVQHIGKESDHWEEQLHLGEDNADIEYGLTPEGRARCVATIAAARKRFAIRTFCRAARRSDKTIAVAVADPEDETGSKLISASELVYLAEVAGRMLAGMAQQTAEEAELLEWAFDRWVIEGRSKFAERVEVDQSNLSKALRRKGRKVSGSVMEQLRTAKAEDELRSIREADAGNF